MLATVLLTLIAAAPGGAVEGPTGRVEPRVDQGPRLRAPCAPLLLGEEGRIEGEPGAPVEAPLGRWRLLLRCQDVSGTEVLVPGPTVAVKADETLRPRVEASAAPLRVIARRNGQRAPAAVRFFLPDVPDPVLEAEAGTTTWVGRGDWRLEVSLHGAPATVGARVRRWKPGRKVTVVTADISDGRLVVRPTLNGKPTDTAVRITRLADEQPLPPAAGGEILSLLPGRYRVETRLSAATDFARQVTEAEVSPGRTTTVQAPFRMGRLRVELVRDRAPLNLPVHLSRPGAAEPFNFVEAPGEALLSEGRYRLHVEGRLAGPTGRYPLGEVEVRDGRSTRVRTDLSPAVIELEVDGPPGIEIELREAGGGDEVAPSGAVYRAWAGRYEVQARLDGRVLRVDGPFEVELGTTVHRRIEVPVHTLTVSAVQYGAPVEGAEFQVYRAGAARPVADRRGPGPFRLLGGTYDLRATYGAYEGWRRGIELTGERAVEIALPPRELPADPPPEGFELPEGDAPPEE